ncbi:MAG TPA: glycerol-3-phosphate dehydrogenase/oxidase [Candidatus Dormibacteraeota bacterium]|nr:glycerol-3-phosphate dehydrogenase/oxidase [Candidatus Dormibacteraeota bacterium]
MQRPETVERLHRGELELLVIGGGIIGARIAFEAARRGLATALVDAGDFGGATSSASSKLVHGGFRYLPMGDIALVRQSQRERTVLLESVAPNLVRPIPFLLPSYRGAAKGPGMIAAGILLYRSLAGRGGHAGLIGPATARGLVPPLRTDGLVMCGVFEEAETIDARLVLATVKAAAKAGALVLNHAKVTGLDLRHNRGGAVTVDTGSHGAIEVHARHVINATGPWVDRVRRLDDPNSAELVRLSKGVHLLAPLESEWKAGVALPLGDGRVSLGIPWQGMLMLGTTDTLFTGDPSRVEVTQSDARTVLDEASRFLPPDVLKPDRVRFEIAGLRALPVGDGNVADARRDHVIDVSRYGLISVAGGKLTTHRLIALHALSRVRDDRLRVLVPDSSRLPGTGWSPRVAGCGLEPDVADHLERLYGDEAGRVLDLAATMPDGLVRIHPGGPDVWAQAMYAVRSEWAVTANDIARRRTTLSVRGHLTEAIVARLAAIAYSNGLGAAGVGAAQDRRADSPHAARAPQGAGDNPVRAGSR